MPEAKHPELSFAAYAILSSQIAAVTTTWSEKIPRYWQFCEAIGTKKKRKPTQDDVTRPSRKSYLLPPPPAQVLPQLMDIDIPEMVEYMDIDGLERPRITTSSRLRQPRV
ncbi:hypothetical protein BGZ80_003425 [Entomortierella chlamydospora]|uniref:Uncharacterized protein n=1 Tax=Entomortierella chlamydospora TaxID=101097 RepID=A0A9P6MNJ4_9FUNG|nr:hypothetical protein BGZ80_003425 [Entomortierella chlamydospora]